MANEDQKTERFFDHLSRADQPTKLGAKWANRAIRRLFALASPAPGSRVLEIGPGRGDFADLCLTQQMDYHAIEPNSELAEALRERGGQGDVWAGTAVAERRGGIRSGGDDQCDGTYEWHGTGAGDRSADSIRASARGQVSYSYAGLSELAISFLQLRFFTQLCHDTAAVEPVVAQCRL